MSMQDTIADMLTRIRNAQMMKHQSVAMPFSKVKLNIAKVLKNEGYIRDASESDEGAKKKLNISLKYFNGQAVIDELVRVSKSSMRHYATKDNLPHVRGGLGIAVVSTSQGIMTDRQARELGIGGEVICTVA